MVEYYLGSMLGEWGRLALDFMLKQPSAIAIVMVVWLGLFAAGRLQLWHIRQKSEQLVVETGRELVAAKRRLTAEGLYNQIYPHWSTAVPGWAWFVPHRLELWPVRATAEVVQEKLAFSPEWIAETLQRYQLTMAENERVQRS